MSNTPVSHTTVRADSHFKGACWSKRSRLWPDADGTPTSATPPRPGRRTRTCEACHWPDQVQGQEELCLKPAAWPRGSPRLIPAPGTGKGENKASRGTKDARRKATGKSHRTTGATVTRGSLLGSHSRTGRPPC